MTAGRHCPQGVAQSETGTFCLQLTAFKEECTMQAEGRRNDSGPASPSGRGTERHLRVHAHSKTVKEFTDLCLIQEINAHNGEPDLIMGTAACVFHLLHVACAGHCNLPGRMGRRAR